MYCQIVLVGNLGRDPELRFTNSGRAVCNFSLAVNRKWKDRDTGELHEQVTWFRVTVWGNQAETCNQWLEKGKQVLVVCNQIAANAYKRNDGEPGASLNVVAQEVRFLSRSSSGGGYNAEDVWDESSVHDADDIPF